MGWSKSLGALALCSALLAGCAGSDHQLPTISPADRAAASRQIAAAPDLKQTTRTAAQNEQIARRVMQRLQSVTQPVCKSAGQSRCWHTLAYSPSSDVNATVLKNQITVYNGLGQFLETDDEFAAVIAHEMGHNIAGHYEDAAQNRVIGATIGGLIMAGILGALGSSDTSSVNSAMDLGESIGHISFSKEHEREADYLSAYLMTRAGYNPDVAHEVWIKLAKMSGRTQTSLLDTHPAGPDRLAAWQKSVREVRYSSDLVPNLAGAAAEPQLQVARVFSGPETTPAVGGTATALAAAPSPADQADSTGFTQALVAAKTRSAQRSWRASGQTDSCGASWVIKLHEAGDRLLGNFWWNGVKYDIHGKRAGDGSGSARAGKSAESRNTPGPRFFHLNVRFSANGAQGDYRIEGQGQRCVANYTLIGV